MKKVSHKKRGRYLEEQEKNEIQLILNNLSDSGDFSKYQVYECFETIL